MASNTGGVVAPNIVDIYTLIEDYVWDRFEILQSASRKREYRGLERDDVEIEINSKHLVVVHDEPNYQNVRPTSSKPWTLFKTVFTNNTNRPQEYSFKTERATESVCVIAKEQGYCLGLESNLTLKTPCEVFEANAGFKHEISLVKAVENSISETLTWGVDSTIIVPGNYQTTAELVVEEMQYQGRFTVVSHLSGNVTASIIRRKDSTLILALSTNIAEVILKWMSGGGELAKELKPMCTVERQNRVVHMTTKGNCSFQFAMKQRVLLHEESSRRKETAWTQTDN